MAKPSKKQKQSGKRSAALKARNAPDNKRFKPGKRKDSAEPSSAPQKKRFGNKSGAPQKKRFTAGAQKSPEKKRFNAGARKAPEKKRVFFKEKPEVSSEASEPKNNPSDGQENTPNDAQKHTSNDSQKTSDRKAKKEMLESRKRKRKPNFDLEKDVVELWEKMRRRDLSAEERSRVVSKTLTKMKGKLLMMAKSHTCSRVLQSCVKHCSVAERNEVFGELKPHFLDLAFDTYACHLAQRILDHTKKDQLQQLLSAFHGKVTRLLRHPSGSAVIEHAYQLANGSQKQDLVSEFFSPEYRLFKNINPAGKNRIVDILSGEPASKRNSVLQHMTLALQPILEKGIVDHSLTHRALVEFLTIAPPTMVRAVVEQLSGPLLVRMIHTADGAKLGILCVRNGSPKERKKIVKALKSHVLKIAQDDHGYAVLLSIFDVVDDTELVRKIIISELANGIKDLALNKYGHRLFLHLLAPNTPRYLPAEVLKALQCPIELCSSSVHTEQAQNEVNEQAKGEQADDEGKENENEDEEKEEEDEDDDGEKVISKKDPLVRRTELLIKSGFAEKLAEVCAENAGELLRSPVGKDVIFEVARGGVDGITLKATGQGISSVHKAIAELAALPKGGKEAAGEAEVEEHVLEHFHSSRTIRRLVLESTESLFAEKLWRLALKGRCQTWAQGHSEKVVSAFKDARDPGVKRLAKDEIDSLVARGLLVDRKSMSRL